MKCRACGESFEDAQTRCGYDEYPYGEGCVSVCTYGMCPVCGSDDLSEECTCVQCGEEVVEAELKSGFCRFCAEELEQTLDWICSQLTPAQMRWMAEHPEWIERGDAVC